MWEKGKKGVAASDKRMRGRGTSETKISRGTREIMELDETTVNFFHEVVEVAKQPREQLGVAWNCWGLGSSRAEITLAGVSKLEHPNFVFLSETKLKGKEWNRVKRKVKMHTMVSVDCQGKGRDRRGDWPCCGMIILKSILCQPHPTT